MAKRPDLKKITKTIPSSLQGSGYERGFWLLVGASGFMLALLFVMESSRARPLGFGFTKKVEVERITAEEAHRIELNKRNN